MFKAHRLVYHSTLGWRVIKKKKKSAHPSFRLQPFASRASGFGFRVQGLFRVSGFGFRVSGFGFRVSGFGYRVSGIGSRVSGFGFRDSGFGFTVCFGFRVSGFGFRVSGREFRGQSLEWHGERVSGGCRMLGLGCGSFI